MFQHQRPTYRVSLHLKNIKYMYYTFVIVSFECKEACVCVQYVECRMCILLIQTWLDGNLSQTEENLDEIH